MTEEKQIEGIVKLLELDVQAGEAWTPLVWLENRTHRAKTILKFLKEQAGYVQLDEDQSLPEVPLYPIMKTVEEEGAYMLGQQDMLNSGFRRIRKE